MESALHDFSVEEPKCREASVLGHLPVIHLGKRCPKREDTPIAGRLLSTSCPRSFVVEIRVELKSLSIQTRLLFC